MSKTVDTNLRIRAQNLASKTIDEIADDVDRLTKAQQAQTKSADLAARSTKELVAEQTELAAINKELERRSKLAGNYSEQAKQITELAAKLQNLTRISAEMSKGGKSLIGFGDRDVTAINKAVAKTENELSKLVTKNEQTGESLRALGVDTAQLGTSTSNLSGLVEKSAAAYSGAVADVRRYEAALKDVAATQAEAQRRLAVEANQRSNVATNLAGDKNRATELATLRADIELRSAQARSLEIATTAAARLAAEQAKEASQQPKINESVRQYISLANARMARQAALNDAFGRQLTLQEREQAATAAGNARRERLVALLGTERGQRILASEAARQQAQASNEGAAATERAAKANTLFADTGRKSLSVYQRIRGQILGLASAYIGVYQSISTVQEAIDAVNRNNTLRIGLQAANGDDVAKAANDYKYLREEADRLGLVFDQIAPKFANIKIGAVAAGFSSQETRKVFTNLQTIVAGLGLTAEEADRVNYAVTQIFSKGKVYSEELNGQLGDVLPGAFTTFAQSIGKSGAELTKMLKDGKVGLDDFTKFLDTYSARYAGNLGQITDRLQGSIARARNAYNDWLRDLLNSGNQTALKNAFAAITTFFEGEQGKEFAQGLGEVFSYLVDVFILLAKHVDIVAAAFKTFLALQIVKFGVDITTSVVGAAAGMLTFAKNARTAATATAVLSGEMRLLQIALGPVGAAVAAFTALLYDYYDGAREAQGATDRFIDALHRANQAKGSSDIVDQQRNLNKELEESQKKLKDLQGIKDNQYSFNPVTQFQTGRAALRNDVFGGDALETKITEQLQRQEAIRSTLAVLSKRQALATEQEAKAAAEEAANAKKIRDAAAKVGSDEDAAKQAKLDEKARKKAEAAAKAAEAAANRKSNAERAFEKEVLDIQDEIQKAQIDSGLVTQAQIDANYSAAIKRIDIEIAKRRTQLEQLQQNASTAGVDSSAQSTKIDGNLVRLQAELTARAEQNKAAAELQLHEKAVNDLIEARDAKIQLINALQQNGSISQLEAWRQTNQTQDEYNAKIREQIAQFTTFLSSIDPSSDLYQKLGIEKVIQGLALANAQATKLSNLQLFSQKYGAQLASGFGDAMGALAKGLAAAATEGGSLSDAFKGALDAFRSFAADFLVQIGQMIIQAIVLQAITNAISGGSGGYYGAVVSAFTGHTGGVVSGGTGRIAGNKSMSVNPAVFAGAQRFHGGGFPGLAKNEVPAILKKKEEVLTEDDPRNALNGGAAPVAAAGPNITLVNTIDSEQVVREGMSDANMNLFINSLGKRSNQVKKILGVNS